MGSEYQGNLFTSRRNILRSRHLHHHMRCDHHRPADPTTPQFEYQAGAESRCGVPVPPGSFHHHLFDIATHADSSRGIRRWKFDDARFMGNDRV
jgi:hypothetical protein